MTIEEFTHRVETDPAYRAHVWSRVCAGTLGEDEELLILKCALGPPPRRWANTERTTPWPTVLLMLVREHRARADYVVPTTRMEVVGEAWAIRCEAQRRLTNARWRTVRPQLRTIIQTSDETFAGQPRGIEPAE